MQAASGSRPGRRSTAPQYTEGVIEAEAEERIARQQEMEDCAAVDPALPKGTADELEKIPWDRSELGAADNSIIEVLRAMGATEQEIQDETAAEARRAESNDSIRAGHEQGAAEPTDGRGEPG